MSNSILYNRKLKKKQKICNKIALTENKTFNLVVLYGNREFTSWIQNVKHTARLLLTVSTYRKFGQAAPTNCRIISISLSTTIPQ
jgi:hypothetical protein